MIKHGPPKGYIPKNLSLLHSLPRTPEWRRNIGLGRKGILHTEEAKRKCGLANKGKKLSEDHKRKISENNARYWLGKKCLYMTGKRNWNYGKFGKEHPHWVENKLSSLRKSIRQSYKYCRFKAEILKRDKFTCVLCGIKGVYLELDHYPKGFSEILREHNIQTFDEAIACKELWQSGNGRTLCQPCHETTDNFPKQLRGKRKILKHRYQKWQIR